MKLYRIYESKVPSMQNTPCKIAVFTDDAGGFKVFQKMLWKSGRIGKWGRNFCFKSVADVERCVAYNNELNEMPEREITSLAYKRADRRNTQAVLRNMGY